MSEEKKESKGKIIPKCTLCRKPGHRRNNCTEKVATRKCNYCNKVFAEKYLKKSLCPTCHYGMWLITTEGVPALKKSIKSKQPDYVRASQEKDETSEEEN